MLNSGENFSLHVKEVWFHSVCSWDVLENLLLSLVEKTKVSTNDEKRTKFMGTTEEDITPLTATRIAVYDSTLAAPRTLDVEPSDINQYIEDITTKTYDLALQQGGTIPYSIIREVCENFIHARFKDPCVSILDNGNTIKFTDQGPGIPDKQRAQRHGFTSATSEMRKYIRGVGSGFPTIRDYLQFSNGRIIIEDNIKEGTVVTIQIDKDSPEQRPVVFRETLQNSKMNASDLSEREYNILALAKDMNLIGPSDLEKNLDIKLSTAYRALEKLEESGFLEKTDSKKRKLTDLGRSVLE